MELAQAKGTSGGPGWASRAGARSRRGRGGVVAAAATAVALLALWVVAYAEQGAAVAQGSAETQRAAARMLTADEVVAAFQSAGLDVENVRQEQVGGGPSGPPATEHQAWGFSVREVAPSGGRIMVFVDGDKLNKKAAWFRRAGSDGAIIAHENVILWLNPAIEPSKAAEYRKALRALR